MATIGAFHAYFIDLSTTSFGQGKYLLCFADSSFADCWWRLVSEDDSLKEYELCRIKPQYYVGSLKNNDGINKCLYLGVENRNDDHNTVSKAMFVRDIAKWDSYGNHNYNQPECIPAQEAPEYRSGSCYYIRSKAKPYEYWHLQHGYVYVSRTERTQFCIARALGDSNTFDSKHTMTGYDTIMIPNDQIIIAAVHHRSGSFRGGIRAPEDLNGPLMYRQRGEPDAFGGHKWTLGELLTRRCFHVLRNEGQSLVWYNPYNVGEFWELV